MSQTLVVDVSSQIDWVKNPMDENELIWWKLSFNFKWKTVNLVGTTQSVNLKSINITKTFFNVDGC